MISKYKKMSEVKKNTRFGVRVKIQLILAVLYVISVDAKGGGGGSRGYFGSRGYGYGGSSYSGGSWSGVYSRPYSGTSYGSNIKFKNRGFSGSRNTGLNSYAFGNS